MPNRLQYSLQIRIFPYSEVIYGNTTFKLVTGWQMLKVTSLFFKTIFAIK